jgi:hypothetical protein
VVPVSAQIGFLFRDDDQMADAGGDVLVAPGTEVRLGRLEWMDDPGGYLGIRAHKMRAAATMNAAATYT